MAVTLIVEDGSGVANANSYATLDELKAYADARGLTLPTDDDTLSRMCIVAMDYIEGFEDRFKGIRTTQTQALSWPRSNVYLNGYNLGKNIIPTSLKSALCQLTADATALKGVLVPNQTDYAIKSETIGPMSTTYAVDAVNGSNQFVPTFGTATSLLRPLFRSANGGCYR